MKSEKQSSKFAKPAEAGDLIRRHRLSALDSEHDEGESEIGSGNLSRVFTFLLLLHVFLIAAVVLYNVIAEKPKRSTEGADPAAAVADQATMEEAKAPVETVVAAKPVEEPVKLVEHIVRTGEDVNSLAAATGVSVAEIIRLNRLNANGDVYVGRRLMLPKAVAPSPSPAVPVAVAVEAAKAPEPKAGAPAELKPEKARIEVAAKTIFDKPAEVRPSTPTKPKVEATVSKATPVKQEPPPKTLAAKPPAAPAKPAQVKQVVAKSATHTVQSGDTFYSIARKHGVNVQALMSLNGITDPGKLRKNTVLKVPAK